MKGYLNQNGIITEDAETKCIRKNTFIHIPETSLLIQKKGFEIKLIKLDEHQLQSLKLRGKEEHLNFKHIKIIFEKSILAPKMSFKEDIGEVSHIELSSNNFVGKFRSYKRCKSFLVKYC